MLDVLGVREEITRPYLAPPGIPPERLALLRRAFDATVRDPAYLTDMARQQLEVAEPSSGEELAAVVEQDRQDAACGGAADGHAVRQLQGCALTERYERRRPIIRRG